MGNTKSNETAKEERKSVSIVYRVGSTDRIKPDKYDTEFRLYTLKNIKTIKNCMNYAVYCNHNNNWYICLNDELVNIKNWKIKHVFSNVNDDGVFWVTNKNKLYYTGIDGTNFIKVEFNCSNFKPPNPDIIDIKYNGEWGIILLTNNLIIFDFNIVRINPSGTIQTNHNVFEIDNNIKERRRWNKYDRQQTYKIAIGQKHCLFLDESGNVRSGSHPGNRADNTYSYFYHTSRTVFNDSVMINFDNVYIHTKRQRIFVHGFIRSYFKDKYNKTPIDVINLLWQYVPVYKKYIDPNSFYERIKIKDIKCGFENNLALDQNGNVYHWWGHLSEKDKEDGDKGPMIIKILMDYNIVEIECGSNHMYAKSESGKHFLWGENRFRQCLNDKQPVIYEPFCINETVQKKTDNVGPIVGVYLGNDNTEIIFACSESSD